MLAGKNTFKLKIGIDIPYFIELPLNDRNGN